MLNNKFRGNTYRDRIDNLYNVITSRLGSDIDENVFDQILNYISLDKQYYIENVLTDENYSDSVFNGYRIINNEKKYCIKRYNVINILGGYIPGYKQNDKVLRKTIIDEDTSMCIAFVFSTTKGWHKLSKTPIIDESYKLYILDRRKLCV